MSHEFLDFVENILDGMNKAETLLEGVRYSQFETDLRMNEIKITFVSIISSQACG